MIDPIQAAAQARSELRQTEAAFQAMKDAAVANWLASKPADTALREEAYRLVNVIDEVRKQLHQVIATGDIEQFTAEQRRETDPPQ